MGSGLKWALIGAIVGAALGFVYILILLRSDASAGSAALLALIEGALVGGIAGFVYGRFIRKA